MQHSKTPTMRGAIATVEVRLVKTAIAIDVPAPLRATARAAGPTMTGLNGEHALGMR
jgi:hypothetical protein